MAKLWNKFLLLRRDGTVPEWPWLGLGARDPAAPTGIRAMADKGEELGYDSEYIADLRKLADEWDAWCADHGVGDPDAGPHREDEPWVVRMLDDSPATVNFRHGGQETLGG